MQILSDRFTLIGPYYANNNGIDTLNEFKIENSKHTYTAPTQTKYSYLKVTLAWEAKIYG